MNKESKYNAPRVGKKRWSTKYKKKINCSNPKGFSQKQYCKRKRRGGAYKSSYNILNDLVKLANHLDNIFLTAEADQIDSIISKLATAKDFSSRLQAIADKDQAHRKAWEKLVKRNGGWDISEEKMEKLRQEFSNKKGTKPDSLFGDEDGQQEFLEMLEEGFDYDNFSRQDWKNIFIISQHFDSRREIQKKMKQVFKKYLGDKSQEYRSISDRISCAESGDQKFGTQNICEKDAG